MTAQLVPTGSDPFYDQTTGLDGVPYVLSFAFLQRSGTWSLSIATLDGTPVVSGVKLVCLWSLLDKSVNPNKPPGMLFALSATKDLSPPGLLDLAPGGRCTLVYMPAADVATIVAGGTP